MSEYEPEDSNQDAGDLQGFMADIAARDRALKEEAAAAEKSQVDEGFVRLADFIKLKGKVRKPNSLRALAMRRYHEQQSLFSSRPVSGSVK